MIDGQDWSSYQGGSPSTAGLGFAFVKRTQGLTYTNPKAVTQVAAARGGGLVVGHYHYPQIANSPVAECDYFLRQLGADLEPGDMLCLDWEWYGQSVTDQEARDYKAAFLAHLLAVRPTHRRVLYCDRNVWLNVDTDSQCGDALWIADYTTAGQPRITHPWTFHQYASSPMDKDVANFPDAQALRTWALALETETEMPLSDTDIAKVAAAVTHELLTYVNGPAGTPDLYGMLGDIHKATVAPSIRSLVDGAMHTLGDHMAATNEAALAVKKKLGA